MFSSFSPSAEAHRLAIHHRLNLTIRPVEHRSDVVEAANASRGMPPPPPAVARKCAAFVERVRAAVETPLLRGLNIMKSPDIHRVMLTQARKMALVEPRVDVCDCIPCGPPTSLGLPALRSLRRSRSAFVYLSTARRRAALAKSIDALFEHYNDVANVDVLVFHNGDFGAADVSSQRAMGRQQVHFVELLPGGSHWQLPFLQAGLSRFWLLGEDFGVGYRHMCRWWGVLFADLLLDMGYEYAARLDDDSRLLSRPSDDIFGEMEAAGAEYAFRLEAFENCCSPSFRQAMLQQYLRHSQVRPTFLRECCLDETGLYNHYGYYNNFFAVHLPLYRRPEVRSFLSYVDWTLSFYLLREGDSPVQSMLVQLFVPKSRVLHMSSWSYLHVSGMTSQPPRCKYGALGIGTADPHSARAMARMLQWPGMHAIPSGVDAPIPSFWVAADHATGRPRAIHCHSGDDKDLPSPLFLSSVHGFHQREANASSLTASSLTASSQKASRQTQPGSARPLPSQPVSGAPVHSFRTGLCSVHSLVSGADAHLNRSTHGSSGHRTSPEELAAREAVVESHSGGRTKGALTDAKALRALLNLYARPRLAGRHAVVHGAKAGCGRQGCIEAVGVDCGAGCSLSFLIKPLLLALVSGAHFVATASRFASSDTCEPPLDGRLECFFEPFMAGGAGGASQHTRKVRPEDHELMQQWSTGEARVRRHLPQLARRGWFWLVSQLFAFVTQPSGRLRAKVASAAASAGVDAERHRPLLGLHVRLGDACTDDPQQAAQKARKCAPLAAYMPHVRRMVRTHGYKAIYLATDSEAVVAQAHADYPEFVWLHQRMDRGRVAIFNRSGITIETVLLGEEEFAPVALQGRRMGFTPAREFDEFMVDTFLLAQSDGLVGHFANNMDRIAYALMSAYATPGGTCLKPYVSVGGANWCFDCQVVEHGGSSGKTAGPSLPREVRRGGAPVLRCGSYSGRARRLCHQVTRHHGPVRPTAGRGNSLATPHQTGRSPTGHGHGIQRE